MSRAAGIRENASIASFCFFFSAESSFSEKKNEQETCFYWYSHLTCVFFTTCSEYGSSCVQVKIINNYININFEKYTVVIMGTRMCCREPETEWGHERGCKDCKGADQGWTMYDQGNHIQIHPQPPSPSIFVKVHDQE
jgi:hypothetical protein